MTAIDKLCHTLAKMGVEYVLDEEYGKKYPPEQRVTWSCDIAGEDMTITARDYCIGRDESGEWEYCLDLEFHEVFTPAQAIAATVGRGTCKVDVLNTGDCAGYECSEYIMHCNACGHEFGHVLYNEDGDVWMSERPNFCPNCGAKVVDE